MSKRSCKPEEIIAKLRQVDIFAQPGQHNRERDPPDRRERSDVLSLAQGAWRHED